MGEELNQETKLLFQNVKYKKRKKKYFFKWDKGNLKLINAKTNKEKNLSVKKSSKKNKINNIKENKDNDNILNEFKNFEDFGNKKEEKEEEKKENKVYNDDDEEETGKMFEGINVNELFKINKKYFFLNF